MKEGGHIRLIVKVRTTAMGNHTVNVMALSTFELASKITAGSKTSCMR